MDRERQNVEVDRNYGAFVRMLVTILPEHRDQLALMRDGKIVDFYDTPGAANRAGIQMFADQIFSIQEVTDEPMDLGLWSHVASH